MLQYVAARGCVFGRRARGFAALATAVIPGSIVVHLIAEFLADGDGGDGRFFIRHGYFAVICALLAGWCAVVAGFGRGSTERRRRCALLRAEIVGRSRSENIVQLLAANVSFFAVTQGVEGVPIAGGALALGLGVALAGSLLAALFVYIVGCTLSAAGSESAIAVSPLRRAAVIALRRGRGVDVSRHATFIYSLFVPNRPPPFASRI